MTKEDKKGLDELYREMDAAWAKHDVNAVAAFVDFPVLMMTDDSQGNVDTQWWTKERWVQTMTETMKNMPQDTPHAKMKRNYWFITDSIADVHSENSHKMGGKSMAWRSAGTAIRKDGKWLVKSMIEGGWGDAMKPNPSRQQGMH